MIDNNDITIIIPTLNRTTLQRAVDSVLKQSARCDILVAGDGMWPTVPASPAVVRCAAPKLGSAGLVRNWALPLVQTNWVGFLDDDDILYPDYVAHYLLNAYEPTWPDILIYKMNNYGMLIPNGNEVRHGNVGMNFCARKDVLMQIPFVNETVSGNEDFIFMHEAQQRNYKIKWLDYLGYMVRP